MLANVMADIDKALTVQMSRLEIFSATLFAIAAFCALVSAIFHFYGSRKLFDQITIFHSSYGALKSVMALQYDYIPSSMIRHASMREILTPRKMSGKYFNSNILNYIFASFVFRCLCCYS